MAAAIYLDHAASTPVDNRVLERMVETYRFRPGNPHNRSHPFGRSAWDACERARAQVAGAIGATTGEVVATGSATEANNLALLGAARAAPDRRELVTAASEHASVLAPLAHLEEEGWRVIRVGVDRGGRLDLDALRAAVSDATALVSVMWVNNETGALQDIASIASIARARGALFHCDAAQALGRVPVDVEEARIDLLTLSGHKIYGPMGSGALWVRDPRSIAPILHGGGQQGGLRSGTLDVPGLVGLGEACELAAAELGARAEHLSTLTSRLRGGLAGLGATPLLGPAAAAPGILGVAFEGVEAETLLAMLGDELALSQGAACHSMRLEPSHVLRAMGLPGPTILSTVRFSPGKDTTLEEIDLAVRRVGEKVSVLRSLDPKRQEAS